MSRREAESQIRPASRRASIALVFLSVLGLVFGAACAHDTRYRVLSFFFDGVPEPGSETTGPALPEGESDLRLRQFERTDVGRNYVHTAVRKNQCRDCHRMSVSMETRTPEEGLCKSCHTSPPGDARFVHGPVAVNACFECHHYHESPHPGFVLEATTTLCYRCHDQEDLSTGEHHVSVGREPATACTQCHDPHGGDDRFFLKRSDQR